MPRRTAAPPSSNVTYFLLPPALNWPWSLGIVESSTLSSILGWTYDDMAIVGSLVSNVKVEKADRRRGG